MNFKAIVLILALAGCATPTMYFKCKDCVRTEFKMTDYQCQRDAQSMRAVPTFGQTYPNSAGISVPYISGSALVPSFNENLFVMCMEAHGFMLDKVQ